MDDLGLLVRQRLVGKLAAEPQWVALLAVLLEDDRPHVCIARIRLVTVAALKLNGRGGRIGIGLLVPDGVEGLQVALVVEMKCRLVDPSRHAIFARRLAKLRDVQQLAQHPLFALGVRPIWRPGAMHCKLRVLLERLVALHAVVVRPLGQSLPATVLLVTDRTVGNSFRQGERVVIALTMEMTALAVFVVYRTHVVVKSREPHERLPGRAMTALAIGLGGFVTGDDGPRQEDRVVALEREHGDEQQRHNSAHDRHPSPAPMQAIGDSFKMQIESFGYERIGT